MSPYGQSSERAVYLPSRHNKPTVGHRIQPSFNTPREGGRRVLYLFRGTKLPCKGDYGCSRGPQLCTRMGNHFCLRDEALKMPLQCVKLKH
ncbi:hypothetical protein DPEC_G00150020 [Dallia pectoralis]|uniref:Uncharacterized protein n=1 Tax=Dallia pectoralis TaxID=75939 RepID=A0ACC2GJA9_DALPE|nr:hypothetical protein DPEC_G00150020 [Dallia pectoralis]